ncbi:MAG: anti-sigma factor [Anaerolineaceae bacterium]|nr:anti-sigma factor [Anaerolineaceae bacterium]
MTHLISCKELVDLVADYMDETISKEARAKFEQHLSECGYCSAYVQQMHMTVKLTSQLSESEGDKPAPDELVDIFRKWKNEQKPD